MINSKPPKGVIGPIKEGLMTKKEFIDNKYNDPENKIIPTVKNQIL